MLYRKLLFFIIIIVFLGNSCNGEVKFTFPNNAKIGYITSSDFKNSVSWIKYDFGTAIFENIMLKKYYEINGDLKNEVFASLKRLDYCFLGRWIFAKHREDYRQPSILIRIWDKKNISYFLIGHYENSEEITIRKIFFRKTDAGNIESICEYCFKSKSFVSIYEKLLAEKNKKKYKLQNIDMVKFSTNSEIFNEVNSASIFGILIAILISFLGGWLAGFLILNAFEKGRQIEDKKRKKIALLIGCINALIAGIVFSSVLLSI